MNDKSKLYNYVNKKLREIEKLIIELKENIIHIPYIDDKLNLQKRDNIRRIERRILRKLKSLEEFIKTHKLDIQYPLVVYKYLSYLK